jgi:SAM-dependent methyltransferase
MNNTIEKRFKNIDNSMTFKNIIDVNLLGKKSVLDIGCSYGEFLIHFGDGSTGLTIIKEEADYAPVNNLDIRLGNIEDDEISFENKYDTIFANNILEHLYSPHAFLGKIKDMIKDDGTIIIGVPCIPKIVSLWNLKKFRGSLAVGHINFFTKTSLQKTIERAGWIVIENRSYYFKNKFMDKLLDFISPHLYVVAKKDLDFKYHPKRIKELEGYKNIV